MRQKLEHDGIAFVEMPRLDHEKHDVDRLEAALHAAVHRAIERIHMLVLEARRIDENQLAAAGRQNPRDAVPGRLGAAGSDADLLSDDMVEQGGLADIRPAHDGDISGPHGLARVALR